MVASRRIKEQKDTHGEIHQRDKRKGRINCNLQLATCPLQGAAGCATFFIEIAGKSDTTEIKLNDTWNETTKNGYYKWENGTRDELEWINEKK